MIQEVLGYDFITTERQCENHMISTETITAAQKGDKSAVNEILIECQNEAFTIAMSFVHNEQDAQDIVQEAFIHLFKKIETLRSPEAFHAWFKVIIVNECKTFFKKKKPDTVYAEDMEDFSEVFNTTKGDYTEILPLENIDRKATSKIVFDIVDHLPEKCKTVVIMRYYADMSLLEIAEQLEISINTVKSRLSYARGKIESSVKAYEKQGIKLYTSDFFENLGDIISAMARENEAPKQVKEALQSKIDSYSNMANTATSAEASGTGAASASTASASNSASTGLVNTAGTGLANSVSTGLANSVAAKISIGTSVAVVAICAGIMSGMLNNQDVSGATDASSVPSLQSSDDRSSSLPDESSEEELSEEESTPESSAAEETSVEESSQEVSEPSAESSMVNVPLQTGIPTDEVTEVTEQNLTQPFVADYVQYDTLDYGDYTVRVYYNANQATLVSYQGTEKDVVMPSTVTYNGVEVPVTRAMSNLFDKYRPKVMSYSNGEYVQLSLESVTLSDYLTEIPSEFFLNMSTLTTVKGGSSVLKIGSFAFRGTGIKELNFPELFPNLAEIEADAFMSCTQLKKIVWPESILYLDNSAFGGCQNVEDITIKLENYRLTDLSFVTGKLLNLHIILSGEFDCSGNQDITKTMSQYGDSDDNISIENLYIEFADGKAPQKGKLGNLIGNIDPIKNLYISEGITELNEYEFVPNDWGYHTTADEYYTNHIENIFLPSSVSQISPDAFKEIEGLQSVEISQDNPYYLSNDGNIYYKDSGKFFIPAVQESETVKNGTVKKIVLGKDDTDLMALNLDKYYHLEAIEVDKDNPEFCSIDGVLYTKDGKELICYPFGKTDPYFNIPEGCEKISETYSAFRDYNSLGCIQNIYLRSVTIPESFQVLRYSQFYDCVQLYEAVFFSDDVEFEEMTLGYLVWDMQDNVATVQKQEDFHIYANPGSTAEKYAEENEFSVRELVE